jgi:hypothetical protein
MMIKFLSSLLLAQTAVAFHNSERNLQELECVVDLDAAQSKATEVKIKTERNGKNGYFNVRTYKNQYPWTTPELDIIRPGWCLDFERFISFADYSMDVHSLTDSDLPNGVMADGSLNTAFRAVDKANNRQAVAYIINKKLVGQPWVPRDVEGYGFCKPDAPLISGRTQAPGTPYIIRWQEVQLALWRVIDDVDVTKQSYVTGAHCVAKGIADDAIKNGINYLTNCTNPGELVPLAYTFDDFDGAAIKHQVIISEYPVSEIEGMCTCKAKTPAPTMAPTKAPTPAPTEAPTVAPTPEPTVAPTKAPVVPPTSPPAPDQPPVGDRNGPPTYVKGDPHFKTFGGEMYDVSVHDLTCLLLCFEYPLTPTHYFPAVPWRV